MELLQPTDRLLGAELQRFTHRLAACQGGGDAYFVLQGITSNGIRVSDRLTSFGGVDNQRHFFVFDHINHVRTTFGHLVHAAHRQTGGLDDFSGTSGCDHFEAQLDQISSHLRNERLVVLAHADKGTATGRQYFTGTQLSLGESLGEAVAHAHDFAGGLHLWAKDGVDAREFGEREDRFLGAVEVWNDFLGETDFRQGLAGHDARGHLGQRLADALGHEGYGTRSTRVHFDDENIFALHRHLHVHQTDHAQFQGHGLDLFADLVLDVHGQRVRRQRAGGVA